MSEGHAQILGVSKLGGTRYRVAHSATDFTRAHRMMKAEGLMPVTLTFPTILAETDDGLLAFLGTIPHKDMILCGPLVVRSDKPRPQTVLRLIEAYDGIMRAAGVSTYMTFIGREDERMLSMVERVPGYERNSENADGILFARRL